ncbi:MAG: hypothetical protein RLZZ490_1683 [Cyanobacteriota bacterium]
MSKRQSSWFLKILICFSVLLLCVITIPSSPAYALIRETVEKPGQTVYQSRQTLKDENGQTWQVILFKRVKRDADPDINLRLVGFPGTTSFQHPAPLIIHPDANSQFELEDAFAQENPGENVGQYLISDTFQTSPPNSIWELDLPLLGQTDHIKVPYFVLQEWQELLSKN